MLSSLSRRSVGQSANPVAAEYPLYPEVRLCPRVPIPDLWAISTSGCHEQGHREHAHIGVCTKTEGIPGITIVGSCGTLSLVFRTRFLDI